MDDQNDTMEETFEVYFEKGMDECYKKKYPKAIEYLEKARRNYGMEKEIEKAKCLVNLGATYILLWKENEEKSNLEKAIEVLRCGRQICKAEMYCSCSNDEQSTDSCQTIRANVFFNLAYASEKLEKLNDSKKYYNKARKLYCKAGDTESEVNCLKRIIEVSRSKDSTSAANAFKCLADLYARERKLILQAENLCSEAESLHEGKEEMKAYHRANNAFDVLDTLPKTQLKNEHAATIFNDLGLIFCQLDPLLFEMKMIAMKLHEKGQLCFERALGILDDIDQTKSQRKAIVLQNLGAAYEFQGRHHEALDRYEQAKEIFGQLRYRRGQSHCFINSAFSRTKINGGLRDIEMDFIQALQAAKDEDDKELIWRSLEGLGTTYFLLKDYEKAVESYKEALHYLGDQNALKDRVIEKLEFALCQKVNGCRR